MKITLLAFFILALSTSVAAQKKATDRDLENFKGEVKTVLTEYVETVNSRGLKRDKTRKMQSKYFFDKDGRLAEILYERSKAVFSVIDNFKTFKIFEIRKNNNPVMTGETTGLDEPIDKADKISKPDERFDMKYVYKYDSQGRIVEEREYLNNGQTTEIKTFKYDDQNRLVEENINDTVAVTKNIYKYDNAGNVVEILEDRDIKGAGIDSKTKTVFSEYKLDAKGNWIERKSTWHFEVNGKPLVSESIYYRTIDYY